MKKAGMYFTVLLLVLVTAIPEYTEAQGRRGMTERSWAPAAEREYQPPRKGDRSFMDVRREGRQPAQSQLINQLIDLTEEQQMHINGMQIEQQTEMTHLAILLRTRYITSEEFDTRRSELIEHHQDQLQEVVTEAQWEALETMRTERRTWNRSQRVDFQDARMRLIAEELDLDEATTGKLLEFVNERQEQLDEVRGSAGRTRSLRSYDPEMHRSVLVINLELQDQVRELLDDETYIEWRMLWTAGTGRSFAGPNRGNHRMPGASYGLRQGSRHPAGRR